MGVYTNVLKRCLRCSGFVDSESPAQKEECSRFLRTTTTVLKLRGGRVEAKWAGWSEPETRPNCCQFGGLNHSLHIRVRDAADVRRGAALPATIIGGKDPDARANSNNDRRAWVPAVFETDARASANVLVPRQKALDAYNDTLDRCIWMGTSTR